MATKKKRTPIGRSLSERTRSPASMPVAGIEETPYGYVVVVNPEAVAELGPEAARRVEPMLGETPRIAMREDGRGLTLSNYRTPHTFDSVQEAFGALSTALGSLGVEPGVFFQVLVYHGEEVETFDTRLVPPQSGGAPRVRVLSAEEEFGGESDVPIRTTAPGSRVRNDPPWPGPRRRR